MARPPEKSTYRRYVGLYFPWLYQTASRLDKKYPGLLRKRRPVTAELRQEFTGRHGTFTAGDLAAFLRRWGVGEGDVLLVQSAYDRLLSYAGTPFELLEALLQVVGPQGTLVMPAYFDVEKTPPGEPIDVRRAASTTGVLSELLRRMPGARRSCQLRSAVALGPQAGFLTGAHHRSPYTCGKQSPYGRLAETRGKVLSLGLPATFNTMFHCAEDFLCDEYPVALYPPRPAVRRLIDADGEERQVAGFERKLRWAYFADAQRLLERFDADTIDTRSFHGVPCSLTKADRFLPRLLELARRGIHIHAA